MIFLVLIVVTQIFDFNKEGANLSIRALSSSLAS
jgi:hypothetical protein